jgi:hypothetical protein
MRVLFSGLPPSADPEAGELLGSGGDLVAALIVLRQVPPDGVLNFHRGRAYWLPGGESGG